MASKIWELISIVLAALVAGMFVGPWAALSRSIATFEPEVFLAIVRRMDRNMAQVMRVLMPAAILSIVPVLIISYGSEPKVWLNAAGFLLFVVALLVTMLVEVPIVKQIVSWTVGTLPDDWGGCATGGARSIWCGLGRQWWGWCCCWWRRSLANWS